MKSGTGARLKALASCLLKACELYLTPHHLQTLLHQPTSDRAQGCTCVCICIYAVLSLPSCQR